MSGGHSVGPWLLGKDTIRSGLTLVAQFFTAPKLADALLMVSAPDLKAALREALEEIEADIALHFDSVTVNADIATMPVADRAEHDRLTALRDRCQAALDKSEGRS